jgi:outer membrane biosynthesis protein TonB
MSNGKSLNIRVFQGNQKLHEGSFQNFPVVFGRGSQCHLCLANQDYLSRNHGAVSLEGNVIRVTDLNSKNGILFQGERKSDFTLTSGQSFQIGDLTFEISKTQTEPRQGKLAADKPPTKTNLPKAKSNSPEVIVASRSSVAETSIESVPEHSGFYRLENSKRKFELLPDAECATLPVREICLQGVITWGDDIHDVRNFELGDQILIGPNPTEPIYLPTLAAEINLGSFSEKGAQITVKNEMQWALFRDGAPVGRDEALRLGELAVSKAGLDFKLSRNEVLSVELGHSLNLHLRFVPIPRPLVKKTLLENREEFKIAISVSIVIHLIFSFLSLFSAPKEEKSKVENVPDRFAKLLVEPPKQILAAEPVPTPAPAPTPTPVPQVAKLEEPVPTPVPLPKPSPKTKPKPEKKPEQKPKEKLAEKPIVKEVVKPAPAKVPDKVVDEPVAPPQKPQPSQSSGPPAVSNQVAQKPAGPPPPTAQELAAAKEAAEAQKQEQAMMAALSGLSGPTTAAATGSGVKVAKTSQVGPSGGGVQVGSLVGKVNAKNAESLGLSAGPSNLNAAVGGSGYQGTGSGKAGKKGVQGVVVGIPSFKGGESNGLTQEEVMKVVNKYLSDVQTCYERALFDNADLKGRVEYEWEINGDGSVTNAQVKRSEMAKSEQLNDCVLALFKKMKFPKGKGGMSTLGNIGFPFGQGK